MVGCSAAIIMVRRGTGLNSITIDPRHCCFHRPAKTNSHWLLTLNCLCSVFAKRDFACFRRRMFEDLGTDWMQVVMS